MANQHAAAFASANTEGDEEEEEFAEVFALHENLPFSTLPLLALANSSAYRSVLLEAVHASNRVYRKFLASAEGAHFTGNVAVVADSLGSLLVYDALCSANKTTSCASATKRKADTDAGRNGASSSDDASSHSAGSSFSKQHYSISPAPLISITSNAESTLDLAAGGAGGGSRSVEFGSNVSVAAPDLSRLVDQEDEDKLDFDVANFFAFGSPLGLIMAYRKLANNLGKYLENFFAGSDTSLIRFLSVERSLVEIVQP